MSNDSNGRDLSISDISIIWLIVFGVLTFSILDFTQDLKTEAPRWHFGVDVLLLLGLVGLLGYLSFRVVKMKRSIQTIKVQIKRERIKAESDRASNEHLLKGIGDYIIGQFKEWNLTPTEQDVALYLIKGLSLKEIAEMRQTSLRTIKQHSMNVYQKANVSGRANLTAYFLEDFLASVSDRNHDDNFTPSAN